MNLNDLKTIILRGEDSHYQFKEDIRNYNALATEKVSVLVSTFLSSENSRKSMPLKINYKQIEQVQLQLHLFFPEEHKSGDTRSCILFFFGGGWIRGSAEQFYPQCRYFASRGMVAISADYRIEDKHNTTPFESVKDAKSAVRFVRIHATALGIDPLCLAVGGGSAGGHLAAATATLKSFEEPDEDLSISSKANALVLFNPVFDNGLHPDGTYGYGYERVQERWREFSPIDNLDQNAPPTVIFLGTNDCFIPTETAKRYNKLMLDHNRYCKLYLYENQQHGFFGYFDGSNPYYYDTLKRVDQFLTSIRFLKPTSRL